MARDANDDFTCKWNGGAGRDEKREMMIRDRERFGPRLDGEGHVWTRRGEAEKLTETERGGEVPVKKERWRPKVFKFSAMATRWHCPPRVAGLRSRVGLRGTEVGEEAWERPRKGQGNCHHHSRVC